MKACHFSVYIPTIDCEQRNMGFRGQNVSLAEVCESADAHPAGIPGEPGNLDHDLDAEMASS